MELNKEIREGAGSFGTAVGENGMGMSGKAFLRGPDQPSTKIENDFLSFPGYPAKNKDPKR